jgi:hypothetical protein
MPNYDLLSFVSGFFITGKLPTYFGLARDWHASLFEMSVVSPPSPSLVPLSPLLKTVLSGPQMKLLRR